MKITVRDIVEIAMLVAVAVLLDLPFLKFRIGENGGSISLTMLPLIILCLRRGTIKGFVGCGIIYGLITCLLDGWGFIYFPFDYLLGYGSICVVALFRNKIVGKNATISSGLYLTLGILLITILRTIFSSISSILFYDFTVGAALVYNLMYIIPSSVLCLDVMFIILKPLKRISNA